MSDSHCGAHVVQELVQLTGLSTETVNQKVAMGLGAANDDLQSLSLDQLRVMLLNYLETLNESVSEAASEAQSLGQ
jgi:hypothetical protein